jgi:hypothetical protein
MVSDGTATQPRSALGSNQQLFLLCDSQGRGNAVTLLINLDENGLIESARAEARGRTEAGAVIPTPWEGSSRKTRGDAPRSVEAFMRITTTNEQRYLHVGVT